MRKKKQSSSFFEPLKTLKPFFIIFFSTSEDVQCYMKFQRLDFHKSLFLVCQEILFSELNNIFNSMPYDGVVIICAKFVFSTGL